MNRHEVYNNFHYFDDIYNKKEQYSVQWAFESGQEKLNQIVEAFRGEGYCTINIENSYKKKLKRNKQINNLLNRLFGLLTVFETVISVLLVLVVSQISHSLDLMIGSEVLSVLLLVTFAFIKVFLENRVIRRGMEAVSWYLYKKSYTGLRYIMIKQVEAVDLVTKATAVYSGQEPRPAGNIV
jgi:hypothetical protein